MRQIAPLFCLQGTCAQGSSTFATNSFAVPTRVMASARCLGACALSVTDTRLSTVQPAGASRALAAVHHENKYHETTITKQQPKTTTTKQQGTCAQVGSTFATNSSAVCLRNMMPIRLRVCNKQLRCFNKGDGFSSVPRRLRVVRHKHSTIDCLACRCLCARGCSSGRQRPRKQQPKTTTTETTENNDHENN